MAITDEIREWCKAYFQASVCKESVIEMLDRIDARYEKAMDDSYRDGYQEGKRDGDDDWYEEHESYLEEHGWYQALDADKEVIHADDELFWKVDGDSAGHVTAIGVGQRAGWVWMLPDGGNVSIGREANGLCHYHAPTVEDTLHELIGKALMLSEVDGEDELVAEYAKRLTLRGDTE